MLYGHRTKTLSSHVTTFVRCLVSLIMAFYIRCTETLQQVKN